MPFTQAAAPQNSSSLISALAGQAAAAFPGLGSLNPHSAPMGLDHMGFAPGLLDAKKRVNSGKFLSNLMDV